MGLMICQKNYVVLKINAPFRSCITQVNNMLMNSAEDLDIVMPMYNLLEYSNNYCMKSGILWNYYRDKIDDVDHDASNTKSFKYKTKLIREAKARPPGPPRQPQLPPNLDRSQPPGPLQPSRLEIPPSSAEVIILLKYLSNLWRSLDFPFFIVYCQKMMIT